ncbi:zinc-ribbon domain-containing protein [Hominifimenecus sp. rT4P-3]|uniref:zinc-ribbon domain-containing protein n=1 Tax=Hominifimenecus sp. rT4P-3 TaxID=3242979 RepID=UPI003DA34C3F
MFCVKCGEAIPDGSSVCPKCGANLIKKEEEQAVVYASQKEEEIPEQAKSIKKIPKKALIGMVAVACVIVVVFVISGINKANLKKALVKEWYDVDGSILKVLDIDEDEMEYRLETGYSWIDRSLGTYEWKPVGKNQIKIKQFGDKYETFTIELNDDKDVLKISPAITSTASSEIWYHID